MPKCTYPSSYLEGKRPKIIGIHHQATSTQRKKRIIAEARGYVQLRRLWKSSKHIEAEIKNGVSLLNW